MVSEYLLFRGFSKVRRCAVRVPHAAAVWWWALLLCACRFRWWARVRVGRVVARVRVATWWVLGTCGASVTRLTLV